MKQFLLLFLFFSVASINSQVLFKQDFSNGIGDMITIDNDGLPAHPNVAVYDGAWTITDARSVGNPAAVNNSWYDPAGKADDWLITPVITGIDAKSVLQWNAFAIDPNFPNGYEVYISPTGGAEIADFTDLVSTVENENPNLTQRAVILSEYAGKDIRIAFRDISNDQFLLLVDDIIVQKLKDLDVQVNSVVSESYALTNQTSDVFFQIQNVAYNNISKITIELTDGVTTQTKTFENLNIPFGATLEEAIPYNIPNTTLNNLQVKIISVNGEVDGDETNNTGTTKITGVSKKVTRKLVAEEATGTWCTWCPRGAVFMAKMKEDYPDEFIGIAVHNNDPMVLNAYNAGITALPGFGGFPSVALNRSSIVDPADMPDYMENVNRKQVAPIEVFVEQSKVNRKITIDGEIKFYTNIDSAKFSVVAVIVEDGVKGTAAGYNQVNSYAGGNFGPMGGYENLPNPVPAAMMTYNEVGRALPLTFAGRSTIIPATIKDGDTFIFSVDYTSPSTQKLPNIHSVVFVVDNATGEVISGGKSESFAVAVDDILELDAVSLSPNPASGGTSFVNLDLNATSDVSVNVINSIGQLVASKDYGKLSGSQLLPINTFNFGTGMFYVKVNVNGKVTTQKLVVE